MNYTIEVMVVKNYDMTDPDNPVIETGWHHYETEADVDAPANGQATVVAGLEIDHRYSVFMRRYDADAVGPWAWWYVTGSAFTDPAYIVDDDYTTQMVDDDGSEIVDVYP